MTAGEPRSSVRGRVLGVFKLGVALGLLAFVAWRLPWRDTLVWVEDQAHLEVTGEIEGNWDETRIAFRVDPAAELGQGWPQALRAAAAAGRALPVERRPVVVAGGGKPPPGWEWRPGMPRVFRELDGRWLGAALAAFLLAHTVAVTRWWRLLSISGCATSWWNALRLTFLGLFFSQILPGLTGGDLVKAVLVVREHPERRANAFMTVILDRAIGLWALIGLAAGAITLQAGRLEALVLPVVLTFAAATAAMFFLLFPAPRRALRLDRWIERLPQAERLKKLESAALVFSGRPLELPLAIGLSLVNHAIVIGGTFLVGQAFAAGPSLVNYLSIVPIANTVSALPLSPGGWGVGEATYGTLFDLAGSEAALGVAVSITFRLCTVAIGLAGGLFLLLPGGGAVREVRDELREAEVELEGAAGD